MKIESWQSITIAISGIKSDSMEDIYQSTIKAQCSELGMELEHNVIDEGYLRKKTRLMRLPIC